MRQRGAKAILLAATALLAVYTLSKALPSRQTDSYGSGQLPEEHAQADAKLAARRAIVEAQQLSIRGESPAAEDTLRRAASSGVVDDDLFLVLAQTLLADETAAGGERGEEALQWAKRACALTGYRDPTALATLAAAHRALGHAELAAEIQRTARELAHRKATDSQ